MSIRFGRAKFKLVEIVLKSTVLLLFSRRWDNTGNVKVLVLEFWTPMLKEFFSPLLTSVTAEYLALVSYSFPPSKSWKRRCRGGEEKKNVFTTHLCSTSSAGSKPFKHTGSSGCAIGYGLGIFHCDLPSNF